MATNELTLSHKEIVKAVIVHRNLHEGFWKLNVNFSVVANHGPEGPDPYLAVTIKGIGIAEASAGDPLAVDAAVVNPRSARKTENRLGAAEKNGKGHASVQFCRDVYRSIDIISTAHRYSKLN